MQAKKRQSGQRDRSRSLADSQRAHIRRQHALPIMGWTTSAMPHRYTSWMENERDQALEAFRGLRP